MEVTRVKLGSLEVEELACKITGLDYDEIDADTGIINDELYGQLNIDLDDFTELIRRLLPLIDVVGSALLSDLMKEQQEIISSPIRFNGVHIDKVKQVFEKNGIKYDVGF